MNSGITFQFDWEIKLIEALQSVMGDFAVALASFFTIFGEQLVLVAILAFLYWSYDKKIAKKIIINVMFGITWAPMLKNMVFRRRPYFDNPSISCLKPVDKNYDIYDIDAQGFSFPSGHSFCAASCYPGLAYYFRKTWLIIIGAALPVLVAVSRFCLGVHYPTDVIVGLVIGGCLSIFGPKLYDRYMETDWFPLLALLTALPGAFFCRTSDYYSGLGLFTGFTAGIIFERHYVNFKDTRRPVYMLLRTLGGLAVFLAFGQGLKLVLPANYFTRVLRYAIGTFLAMGPYPMLFEKIEKGGSGNTAGGNADNRNAKEILADATQKG